MKQSNSKINNSCLNIFKLLTLLYSDEAYYSSVYNIFKNDITQENEIYDEKKLNNLVQVVLNKYINALKVFGIKIRKENNKFKLESSLYSINCSIDDIKALNIISSVNRNIPDEDINKNISDFINSIFLRMDNESKKALNSLIFNYDFSFYFSDLKNQIKECKTYCDDSIQLDLVYIYRKKEIRCKCQAKEIKYDIKTAYLSVYDIGKKGITDIPLQNIISINELPSRTAPFESSTTIVYKLKGRLAKTYKLKENEKLDTAEKDGITIINTGEPFDKLYSRLMRYSDLCEIKSPKYIRQKMIDLINETLQLYNNEKPEN